MIDFVEKVPIGEVTGSEYNPRSITPEALEALQHSIRRFGNMTLLIDPESRDLVFDTDGSFKKIYGDDTTVQNVRHTLLAWKAEFFADETHGTDYESIVGQSMNDVDDDEIKEVIREAVFQDPDVSQIDSISVSYEGRTITVELTATLSDGEKIALEVTA